MSPSAALTDRLRRGWAAARSSGLLGLGGVILLAWLGNSALQSWRDHGAADQLRQVARPGDIKLISSVTCHYCTKAREWLTEEKIPFTECLIERDSACMDEYRVLGGRGTPTVLVRDRVQLGFDARNIAAVLGARP